MAVAFRQSITAWGGLGSGPQSSGAFTPTATDTLVVGLFDAAATGRTLVYSGSVNTPTAKIVFNDSVDGNTLGLAEVLSCLGGSQTLTVNSTPSGDGVGGWAIAYSGVSSTAYTSNQSVTTTAPVGNAVAVPAGSALLAFCFNTTAAAGALVGQVSGSVTPTDRQTGTNGTLYAVSEWVGTGSTVTPTWSAPSGDYVVLQVLLSGAAVALPSGAGPLPSTRQLVFVNDVATQF